MKVCFINNIYSRDANHYDFGVMITILKPSLRYYDDPSNNYDILRHWAQFWRIYRVSLISSAFAMAPQSVASFSGHSGLSSALIVIVASMDQRWR